MRVTDYWTLLHARSGLKAAEAKRGPWLRGTKTSLSGNGLPAEWQKSAF